jgi:hypothetical protein
MGLVTLTTILLIDDHDEIRTYYAHRLAVSIPDRMVLEAKDGRSGLALYYSKTIDIAWSWNPDALLQEQLMGQRSEC